MSSSYGPNRPGRIPQCFRLFFFPFLFSFIFPYLFPFSFSSWPYIVKDRLLGASKRRTFSLALILFKTQNTTPPVCLIHMGPLIKGFPQSHGLIAQLVKPQQDDREADGSSSSFATFFFFAHAQCKRRACALGS